MFRKGRKLLSWSPSSPEQTKAETSIQALRSLESGPRHVGVGNASLLLYSVRTECDASGQTSEPTNVGSSPSFASYLLCGFGQPTQPLSAGSHLHRKGNNACLKEG